MNIRTAIATAFIFGLVFFIALSLPKPNPSKTTGPASCLNHISRCMLGQLIYAADHDECLPDCKKWMDSTSSYAKSDSLFRCPDLPRRSEDEYGYAMNVAASSIHATDERGNAEFPVLFDSVLLKRNAWSGLGGFAFRGQRGEVGIGWLDGHVSRMTRERLERALPKMKTIRP